LDEKSASPATGLVGSVRALLAGLVEVGQTRLQLASTELEEERIRLAELLICAIAALFFLGIGIVLAAVLIVVVFWDGPRVEALATVTALFVGVGIWLAVSWRARARAKPKLLAATIAELKRDRDALRGGAPGSDAGRP
jgi:uncharacterized membrane protein YqjE